MRDAMMCFSLHGPSLGWFWWSMLRLPIGDRPAMIINKLGFLHEGWVLTAF